MNNRNNSAGRPKAVSTFIAGDILPKYLRKALYRYKYDTWTLNGNRPEVRLLIEDKATGLRLDCKI